jgi:hypothetical protein
MDLRKEGAMRKISLAIAGLSAAAILGSATPSRAEITTWSDVIGGCIPESNALYNQLFETDAATGEVRFGADKTGTIRFTCPVSNLNTTLQGYNRLVLTANNPFNCGGVGSVSMCLMKTSTDASGVLSSVGCVSTTTSGPWARSEWITNLGFGFHDWSPNDFYYWADIIISRDSTGCDYRAFGTRLFWDF